LTTIVNGVVVGKPDVDVTVIVGWLVVVIAAPRVVDAVAVDAVVGADVLPAPMELALGTGVWLICVQGALGTQGTEPQSAMRKVAVMAPAAIGVESLFVGSA
jgi:hypothetical protein